MSGSLNQTALKRYSADFASKVLADFYTNRVVCTGDDVLTLTPLRQVNLGIVSRIFDQWKMDAQEFRSPYFDFEKPEVKNALQDFMNTVSRHISIRRADLQPLLVQAVEEALRLLITPADYFEAKIRALPNFTFNKESARNLTKFTHIHSGVAKNLSLRLTDHGSEFVFANQALGWLFDMMRNGASLDEKEGYIDQFSSIEPLDVNSLLTTPAPAHQPSVVKETAEEPPANESFFDTALAEVPQETSPTAPQPATPAMADVTMERDGASDMRPTSTGVNSVNSRFKVDIPPPSDENTYGSIPMHVDSIMGSIALGQRFMFVNQLFDKNSDAFDQAIHELDRAAGFDEARNLVVNKFAPKYDWDMGSTPASDLMALVKRKFN